MQFHHPQGLRRPMIMALEAEMPEVVPALLAAGAQLAVLPAEGEQPEIVVGTHDAGRGRAPGPRDLRDRLAGPVPTRPDPVEVVNRVWPGPVADRQLRCRAAGSPRTAAIGRTVRGW